MSLISAKNLSREFLIHRKQPGLSGAITALFSRDYEVITAVDSLSIEIESGELVGFIGPNGAGKTTTLKMFSGLLYPTAGQVSVMGYIPQKRQTKFLQNIALVMGQKNQLWWDLPPMETFLLNQAIYEVPENKFKKNLDKLVDILEVKDVLQTQVRKLSLGQRMKCELIAALLHSPKVLFLDEPTIGLDVVMQQIIRDFIRDYNREFKSTIILTSHNMSDVKELAKRIIIIDHGQILFDGPLELIITKYSPYKIITLVFTEKVRKESLQKYGKVKEFNFPCVTLEVDRTQAPLVASQLLGKFPVADVTIEEPTIEAIIREIFLKHRIGDDVITQTIS